GKYSKITFCRNFFKFDKFDHAIELGKELSRGDQRKLDNWNNRARCFLHEVTHLDWFMNAGENDDGLSPFVSDLEILLGKGNAAKWVTAYGPTNARILRNYVDPDPQYSGYYTQRNADSYAYFALAKYVQKEIGFHPDQPRVGRQKPSQEPRDA
ncbi:hypothetical protein K491DRAFT_581684, partial [Lophiostoma macrostomum CBS 122681]